MSRNDERKVVTAHTMSAAEASLAGVSFSRHQAGANKPLSANSFAAFETAAKGTSARSAISRSEWCPSDRLSTQSKVRVAAALFLSPPIAPEPPLPELRLLGTCSHICSCFQGQL